VVQLEAVAPVPGGCTPRGSIARNGAIVSVVLNFVRGHFFINNPDTSNQQKTAWIPSSSAPTAAASRGPAIYVKPGDTLRVDLINDLDKDDPSCFVNPPAGLSLPAGVGCFNTTNLHTHGLHVSPAGNSDNVLLNIAPQTKFPYEINIPADHPAGTFWYHATSPRFDRGTGGERRLWRAGRQGRAPLRAADAAETRARSQTSTPCCTTPRAWR